MRGFVSPNTQSPDENDILIQFTWPRDLLRSRCVTHSNGWKGMRKMRRGCGTVTRGKIDFPAIVTGPASALHMGTVTRAAKPDLDPETRRRFGRPHSRRNVRPHRHVEELPLLEGAFCSRRFGELPGRPNATALIHQAGLEKRRIASKSAKSSGLVFSYP